MKKIIVNFVFIFVLAMGFLGIGGESVSADSAGTWKGACVASAQGGVGTGDVATIQGITCLVANGMNIVFAVLGFGGLIMMTWAGISYMLSGGKSQGVEKASGAIRGVVIGIILALSSFLIIKLISDFTGMNLTNIEFNESL